MSTITAPQVEKIKEYVDFILPQAGMTGDIDNKVYRFSTLYSGIGCGQRLTEEQMSDLLDFFASREPKDLIAYIEKSIAPVSSVSGASAQDEERTQDAGPLAEQIATKFVKLGGHVIFFPRGTKRCTVPGCEQRATNDLATAVAWAQQDSYANVGLVGKQNGLWALDIDDPAVQAELDQLELQHGRINTYRTRTVSDGLHLIFRQNAPSWEMGNVSATNENKKELLSARINDRYVVLAGSWARPHNDESLPLAQYTAVDPSAPVIEAPHWLLDFIKAAAQSKTEKSQMSQSVLITEVKEGGRNNYLTSLAGKMRQNFGWDSEKIKQELLTENERKCVPPLPKAEVDSIARSIGKKPVQPGDLIQNMKPDMPVSPASPDVEPITVTVGDDFLYEEIPPRKVLVSTISGNEPVIYEQSINQVFAWRGAGKTCLGLGFVRALATGGSFLNFTANERMPVLYIEGELPESQFQERWRSIVGETNRMAYKASIDKQAGHHYVSMATTEGMQKVENTLVELAKQGVHIKVLMLDNISTLFNAKANEEETWIPIQSWFTSLRSRGITVFFFHHAGKGGLSRSHSKSEDMLDVSIKLEEPEEPEVGHLHSLMSFDKARAGLSEKPAEIKLHRTHSPKCSCGGNPGVFFCPGDGVRWEHFPKSSKRDQAYEMFAEGKSIMDVATMLEVAEGTVRTWRTKWAKNNPGKT